MSLTSEIHDPHSVFNRWFNSNMNLSNMTMLVEAVNDRLARVRVIAASYDIQPGTMGTAFDYFFRWTINPLIAQDLVAMNGGRNLGKTQLVKDLVQIGNEEPASQPACCVALAWFEQEYRHRETNPNLTSAANAKELLQAVTPAEVADMQALKRSIPSVWGPRLNQAYIPNPVFDGSIDVGGADADWIIGNVLYDCKCSWKRRPFTLEHLKQVIGYVLLDYSNQYRLSGFGLYFARHQTLIEWPVARLIPHLNARRDSLAEALRSYDDDDIEYDVDDYEFDLLADYFD